MTDSRIRIAVAMGGCSAEAEVSLRSGRAVMAAMDRTKFEPVALEWLSDGRWQLGDLDPCNAATLAGHLHTSNIGCVFIALHGPGGEDGTIQGFLELLEIPYTGPGVEASAIAMDKIATRGMLQSVGLHCAPAVVFDRHGWSRDPRDAEEQVAALGRPVFVKAPTQGSSFGVVRVDGAGYEELELAVETAFRYDSRVLIEKGMAGVEVTAPVLGNEQDPALVALPPVEIRPRSAAFFNYEEKYSSAGAEEVCPPVSLSKEHVEDVKRIALRAHRALRCNGMSRTDMIVAAEAIYVLEVNTIPGLTERSLLPQAAHAHGLSFTQLITRIVDDAVALHRKPR